MWGLELQGDNTTRRFLVKRIVPKELPPKKSHEVWLDFVRSVRTEVQFYEKLMAAPPSVQSLFPTVHHTSASSATLDTAAPRDTQFCLVMEDLVAAGYTQQPCLDTRQARAVLGNITSALQVDLDFACLHRLPGSAARQLLGRAVPHCDPGRLLAAGEKKAVRGAGQGGGGLGGAAGEAAGAR